MSNQIPEQPGLFASVDVVSANKLLNTQQDASKLWMNRIYYSGYFRGFYLMLILVNLACIVWTLVEFGSFPDEMWFLGMEVCLAAMIAVEVAWRMCVQGVGKFWCSLSNVADVIVSAACVVALGFAAVDAAVFVEGFSGEVVLFFRSALQYLRLILFIKNQRKAQDTLLQMINFADLAQPPKPVVQSHMPLEEEDKPSVVPNNTGRDSVADIDMGGANTREDAFSKFDKLVCPSTIRRSPLHFLRGFGGDPTSEAGINGRPFGGSGCVILAAAGYTHSLAVLADAQVYAWGSNMHGELGQGTQGARPIGIPLKVPISKNIITRVAAGRFHSIAVTESGQLFSWGLGSEGQLGYEVRGVENKCQLTPRQVMGLNDEQAEEVACGSEFTVVLTASGKVLTFGSGKFGALGQGAMGSSSRPMPLMGVDDVRFMLIAAGEAHCLASSETGEVFEWGNPYHALNDKSDMLKSPQRVPLPAPAVALSCGADHSVVLCRQGYGPDDSLIFTWGVNNHGQLGYFYSDKQGNHRQPRKVEGITGIVDKIIAGRNYSAALMFEGEIYGWGSNTSGQFGSQSFLEAPTPVIVAGKPEQKINSIVGGPNHLFVLTPADYSYSCATFLEGVGPMEAAASFAYTSFTHFE